MCDLLLGSWAWIVCYVPVHTPLSLTEVPVDRGRYTAAVIDFLRVVGEGSRGDGAWGWLSRFNGRPRLRRFAGLEVVHVHVEIAGFFDGDGRM